MLLIVPWLRANGMALYPFILVKRKNPSATLLNHERIHLRQQVELLVLPFYLWYVLEYLWHRLRGLRHYAAYRRISFEREAFDQDQNLYYLTTRKPWAFMDYL
jgi:hypothetical protein